MQPHAAPVAVGRIVPSAQSAQRPPARGQRCARAGPRWSLALKKDNAVWVESNGGLCAPRPGGRFTQWGCVAWPFCAVRFVGAAFAHRGRKMCEIAGQALDRRADPILVQFWITVLFSKHSGRMGGSKGGPDMGQFLEQVFDSFGSFSVLFCAVADLGPRVQVCHARPHTSRRLRSKWWQAGPV